MKNNHVVFLIPGIDKIGGAERQVISLAQGLALRGWRTSMIALTGTGDAGAKELKTAGVEFLSLHMRKGIADPRGWLALREWIRSEAPDVLHAHLPHATWTARGVRILAPVRVVLDTVHTSATGGRGRRLGYNMTSWLSDRVTTVSGDAADAFVQAGMVKSERVTVLPNGIDVQAFSPDLEARVRLRRELGCVDEFIWFTAGRLEQVKDYPSLILAFAGLCDRSRLLIAGTGSQEPALRRLVDALELWDRVQFLGFQQDVSRWMQAADGFVLSSLWEGLPVSVLEAGACGIPSVTTNVAGTREVVIHEKTGFLTRPASPASLRRTMMRLMQTPPDARRVMGNLARERVTELFSLERVLDRWERLYHDLLQSNRSPLHWAPRSSRVTIRPMFENG